MKEIVRQLLESGEPSARYRTLVDVVGEDPESRPAIRLRDRVRDSPRVQTLLSERARDGTIPHHPYAKWDGAHWVLSLLADLGYPPGDAGLVPMREQVLGWLLSERHERAIRTINGRVRRCASQEGNALHAMLALGLADERVDELARRLIAWQWPDGGWNCDKDSAASISSFHETHMPLRALALYAKLRRDREARDAARRAAEVFLRRRLFRRVRDGRVIAVDMTRLHFPSYWHYDVLVGLKTLAEADFVRDARCRDALDLLESKRLADGGFPAEGKYYRVTDRRGSGRSTVDWGGMGARRANPFVTVEALSVLRKAGRFRA
jgi:hypothetical protein